MVTIPSADEDVEKLHLFYIGGGGVECYSHSKKYFGSFLKSKHLPCDPAVLLLSIYPGEMKTYVHTRNYAQFFMQSFISM